MSRRILLFGLLLSLVSFATLDVFVNRVVYPGGVIYVHGNADNRTTVTATIVQNSSLIASNSSNGTFSIYLTGPSSEGDYTLSVLTATESRTIPITVSEIYTANISAVGSPTYTAGSTFQLNVSVYDSSAQPLQDHAPPNVSIFRPMAGPVSSWTVANQSTSTDSNGNILYNITIPDLAAGTYVALVEDTMYGTPFVFEVAPGDSGVLFSITPQTTTGEQTQTFGTGKNVTLKAKLKYGNGTMISGAAVTAYVFFPDGTRTSVTLNESDILGMYHANFTNTSQSGEYDVEAKAVYGSYTFFEGTHFIVGSYSVEMIPDNDKFFKEAEMGGKIAVMPGSEVGYIVMVRNLTTGDFVQGSFDGTVANTVNCSKITLTSTTRTNDSTSVSLSNFDTSTTLFFGGTHCFVNFTAPNSSGIYKVQTNVEHNGANSTGIAFIPVQTFILKIRPVTTIAGEQTFKQMFNPGANATFSITAINASGSEVAAANVTGIAVQSLFNLPSGQDIAVSTLDEIANNDEDTLQITLPTTPTDAFVLSVNASVTQGSTTETVVGDTFFFSKYLVGHMMPYSGSGSDSFDDPSANMDGPSACNGTERFKGHVMLAGTGESISNVWLQTAPQMMMEERTGKIVTNCISFVSNVSTNGTLYTTATFNSSCNFSGQYFFMANVTYSDDSGMHIDNIPGFFQCMNMKGNVRFQPEGNGYFISSTGKINVSVTNLKYLNGLNLSTGTAEITEMRVFEGFGPPRFLEPEDNLSFAITDNEVKFQLSPSNFSVEGDTATRWSNSEGFVEADIRVCNSGGTTCNVFMAGIPVGSSTEVWVWMDGSRTFVIDQNVTVNVKAKANLSNSFTVKFEKFGMFGGTLATSVSAALVEDGWNSSAHTGFEHWRLNVTVPNLQKGDTRMIITITDNETNETITRDEFGTVQGATLGIPEAGLPFYENNSLIGFLDDPTFNSTLHDQEGWDLAWIMQNFSFSWSIDESEFCYMPNVSVRTYGMDGSSTSTINATTKILGLDSDNDTMPDTLLLRDTLFQNNATNRSAFTVANLTNRSMGYGLYLWEMYGCGYAKLANANDSSGGGTWVNDMRLNQDMLIPYLVKRGSSPVTGATVNITAIYTRDDEGWGLGDQLPATNYTVTAANTNADGIAWVTVNISTAGRYKLFWKLNGSVNETASLSSATEVEVRSMLAWSNILKQWGTGMQTIVISNASQGAGDLMCSGGGCSDVFNGSISNFYGLGQLSMAFNSSNTQMALNLDGTNATCFYYGADDETCYLNTSGIEFEMGGSFYEIGIAKNSSTGSTNSFALYLKEPSDGDQYFATAGQNMTIKICVQNITLSSDNVNYPLTEANISALFIQEFNQYGPPSTVSLTMYDPLTDLASSSIAVWPYNGCAAFRAYKSGGWSSNGEIRANVTAVTDSGLATETIHVANINGRSGG